MAILQKALTTASALIIINFSKKVKEIIIIADTSLKG
jgi:hypothetical protein